MSSLLGIIGGMGTPAGLRFIQYIVDECTQRGVTKDIDFPKFILYNNPSCELDEKGLKSLTAFQKHLLGSVDVLAGSGCTEIVVACNTAYLYLNEMRQRFNGCVPDMIESACRRLLKNADKVGILSSETTRLNGLYSDKVNALGREAVIATDEEQTVLNSAISESLTGGATKDTQFHVMEVVRAMEDRGARQIIVGCTELPELIDWSYPDIHFIDPGREVIRAALAVL
jgi:aspartate racemase